MSKDDLLNFDVATGWPDNGLLNTLPVFTGGKNRPETRAALDGMGGERSFKTRIVPLSDGRMIVQTKGSMPPQVLFERDERIEEQAVGNYVFTTSRGIIAGGSATLSFVYLDNLYKPSYSTLEPFLVAVEDCKPILSSDGYYPIWCYGPTNSEEDRQHALAPSAFAYVLPGSGRTSVATWNPDPDEIEVFIHDGNRLKQNASLPHGISIPGRLSNGRVRIGQLWHGLTRFMSNGELRIGEKIITPLQAPWKLSNDVTIFDPMESLAKGLKNYAVLTNNRYSYVLDNHLATPTDYVCADGAHFHLSINVTYSYSTLDGNINHARINCAIASSYPVIFDRQTYVSDPLNKPIVPVLSQSYPAFDFDVLLDGNAVSALKSGLSSYKQYCSYRIEMSPNRRKFAVLFLRKREANGDLAGIDAAVECAWENDGSVYALPTGFSCNRVENVRNIVTHDVDPIYGIAGQLDGERTTTWGDHLIITKATRRWVVTSTTRTIPVHPFLIGDPANDALHNTTDVRESTTQIGYGADNTLKTITVKYVSTVNKYPGTGPGTGETVYEHRQVLDDKNNTISEEAFVSGEVVMPIAHDVANGYTSLQVLVNENVVWSDERRCGHALIPRTGITLGGTIYRRFYYTLDADGISNVPVWADPVDRDRRFTGEWIELDPADAYRSRWIHGASNNACWLSYSVKKLSLAGEVLVERVYLVVTVDGEVFQMTQEDFNASEYSPAGDGTYPSHWVAYDPASRQITTEPNTTWS